MTQDDIKKLKDRMAVERPARKINPYDDANWNAWDAGFDHGVGVAWRAFIEALEANHSE